MGAGAHSLRGEIDKFQKNNASVSKDEIVQFLGEQMVALNSTGVSTTLVLCGPVIGTVTATTANVLLEIDESKSITLVATAADDGKVKPGEVPKAFCLGARQRGTRIFEGVCVSEVLRSDDGARATGVMTNRGRIDADIVVLTGGMWTRELAKTCGVKVPLYPVEHHYVVTKPIPGARDDLPVGRDPDLMVYFRGEGDGIMLGAFQEESKPAWVGATAGEEGGGIPSDFTFALFDPDWDKFSIPLANGRHRIPALETCEFERFVNGPESFTPDNNFIMGEAPELRGLFVAAGLNSVGIASAAGVGKYLTEWIVEGQPSIDLWSVDIRRFHASANETAFLQERVTEVLGLHYQMAWPNREFETSRGIRKSALYDTLLGQGAFFQQKMNLERPAWFYSSADVCNRPVYPYSFGRQGWFENHKAEHLAAREAVAVFDQSGFSKFELSGSHALAVLQRVCGGDIDVAVGKAVYTGMFNSRGGFESDLVVVRTGPASFYIVTGTTQGVRDADWITKHTLAEEAPEAEAQAEAQSVVMKDVTDDHAVLGVFGPHSRTLMSRLTDCDMSHLGFPFATARSIRVNSPLSGGSFEVFAIRVTYVGELGWECHVKREHAVTFHTLLMSAGRDLSVRNAGHYALNSLRLEKGYRAWGADISPDDSPLEAGLGFAVSWKKGVRMLAEAKTQGEHKEAVGVGMGVGMGVFGMEAMLAQRSLVQGKGEAGGAKFSRMLLSFVLKDPVPVLWGSEPIVRDGVTVGYTTSGSYGFSLGAAVGMGYVKLPAESAAVITSEWALGGSYEISINGQLFAADAFLESPYDAARAKILC